MVSINTKFSARKLKLFFFFVDKNKNNFDANAEWKPGFLKNDEFINLMCEFRNGFYLVFDSNGVIKYVSDNITNLLGYLTVNSFKNDKEYRS